MKKYKPLTQEQKKEKDREYERKVADLFIKGMEKNELPWQKPWVPSQRQLDYNLFSMVKGKEQSDFYKGINGLLCQLTRALEIKSEDPRWCTITQLMAHNKNTKDPKEHLFLKKGVHGLPIKFYSVLYLDKNNEVIKTTGDKRPENAVNTKPVLKTYTIFHASQVYKHVYDEEGNKTKDNEGNFIYKPAFPYEPKVENTKEFKPLIEPEALIKATGVEVIHDQRDSCYFAPGQDVIHMVKPENFKSDLDYYDTFLHELTHWTGHPSRLDREELKKYSESDKWRAKEELIAEIGGYLLAKECNIAFNPSQNNIAYVQSWMQELKDDPTSIFTACKKADQAMKYIVSFSREKVNTNIKDNEQTNDLSVAKSLRR